MTEKEMADRLRESIELIRIGEGIYIFNDAGRFGNIKNYLTDSEHYQVMFDNMTREQVLEIFGKVPGLGTENAKLRELCRRFSEYVSHDRCEGCVYKRRCNDGEVDECWQMGEIRKLARELGVEE